MGNRLVSGIVDLFRYIGRWLLRVKNAVAPGRRAWRGAAVGVIIGALIFIVTTIYNAFAPAGWISFLLSLAAFLAAAALISGLMLLLGYLARLFPALYKWVVIGALLLTILSFFSMNIGSVVVPLAIIMISSLAGASAWVLAGEGWGPATLVQRIIICVALVVSLIGIGGGGYWLLSDGRPAAPPLNAAKQANANVEQLAASDPSQRGSHAVKTLFYGSGKDIRRAEFGSKADLKTASVDGSALVEKWSGLRTRYWGFGPEAMPLNARVWYPEGEGPFPLVLIVHGNHLMEKYSDPGYGYLGELLASRGFILASIDENFLNSSPTSDLVFLRELKEENDARGWLLLEHLKAWRGWNESSGNPFFKKVDMKKIALMGHSRGGEAVVLAAAFNRLPYYPDDATVKFDFNFDIQSVAAIAPVDGQYLPGEKAMPLENVNYFVLHGSHDMDVTMFLGERVYKRLRFTDENFRFKSALYIYGANHGQFNSTWGRKDGDEPGMRLMNLNQLMPAQEQARIASLYLSAFLEATLHDQKSYLPLFRDYRTAAGWLPDTIYLNQYQDSATQLVSTYEEDINLATTTIAGGAAKGENLTIWREKEVPTKAEGMGGVYQTTSNSAVYLGWHTDTSKSAIPSYQISLPETGLNLNTASVLVFSLADSNEDSNPKAKDKKEKSDSKDRQPIDLTLELTDRNGVNVQLPLNSYAFLQPQIDGKIMKVAWMAFPMPSSEIVFQSFQFPLAAFAKLQTSFDPAGLVKIRFIFNRTSSGVVVIDDIGFRQADR